MVYIDRSIEALRVQYDEEIATWLSEKGFGIVQYSEDREVYLKNLMSIKTSSKTLIVLLNQYNAEYKSLNKNNDTGVIEETESEKRFRYEKEIALLSRYQKERINKQTITVFEYAAIINNYLEQNKVATTVEEND